jgi:Arc/MetJ family transcription regulator
MAHHGKKGFRAVSIEISDELRAEVLRITGEATLTAAIHGALVDLVLPEHVDGPLIEGSGNQSASGLKSGALEPHQETAR